MSKFSSFYYRNPKSLKRVIKQLNKELENFIPIQNEPCAILKEIERIQSLRNELFFSLDEKKR